MRGFLVAGPGSGAGKTTAAAALMAALSKRGLTVQPFKCGPDFIDPSHHSVICGRPSHNLDTWILPAEVNQQIFAAACRGADIAVVEGMMGLFDGVAGNSDEGSSSQIARLLGLPVLLVVDASASARSVAALVHGFRTFDPDARVIGVLLNQVAGPVHAGLLLDALSERDPELVIGWLPHQQAFHLNERYLGLHTAGEHSWNKDALDKMAGLIESQFPLDRWLGACQIAVFGDSQPPPTKPDEITRIGIARDPAFCFYYEAGLDELRAQGAELVEFSPLKDSSLPPDLHALYFGGGYPELHAEVLSKNTGLLAGLRAFALQGRPIYGECGGLIFLGRELITKDGTRWPMAGLLPVSVEMTDHLHHFGYAEIEFVADGLAVKGSRLRGHSFHCSKIVSDGDVEKTAIVRYTLSPHSQPEGFKAGNIFGSYVHLHFAANPWMAARFISLARPPQAKRQAAS